MKPNIPVTLCCVDCINYPFAIDALRKSSEKCIFSRTLLLTDRDYNLPDIDTIKIPPIRSRQEYSKFILHQLHHHIETEFVLLIQWDGYVIHPNAWTNEFLNYDYIGAVWGQYKDNHRVGNGGFSLRSRKLLLATKEIPFDGTLEEDVLICRQYRPFLEEKYAIRFAPDHTAEKFSFETTYPTQQPFGFHGLFNLWMALAPNKVEEFVNRLPAHITNSVQFFQLGVNYLDMRQYPFAKAIFQRILANNAGHADARRQMTALEAPAIPNTPGRNEKCPCGSGERYKNCCGKLGAVSYAPLQPREREKDIHWVLSAALKHHQLGHIVHANAMYGLVLHESPQNAIALQYSGVIAYQSGDAEKAAQLIEQAIQIQPAIPDFHNNLGLALQALGIPSRAEQCFRQAIKLNPNYAEAYNNLGLLLEATGHSYDAIDCFEKSISIMPDFAQAHWNLSLSLLITANFSRGWKEYEWRLKTPELAGEQKRFSHPLWEEQDIFGKTILIHTEQGLGDAIQFIRYIPQLASLNVHVLLECKPALKQLFQTVQGIKQIVSPGEPVPRYDFHCPLLSLPSRLNMASNAIPTPIPYLFPDENRIDAWRKKMPDTGRAFKVGLMWAGSPENPNNQNRSLPLSKLDLLGTVKNVVFYNLQKGDGADQAKQPLANLYFIDLKEDIGDFASTAALIANLDLVISVDTSVAHLAGAIGKPAWVMLPFAPDWRWLLDRDDSPWYPTHRLFRQREIGNWEEVISRVKVALDSLAEQAHSRIF